MSILFWKKKQPQLTREESMGAVVFQTRGLRVVRNKDGIVTLFAPFRASPVVTRIAGWLGAPPEAGEAKVELDELGTFVWDMCDGKATVREMITRLAERHKLNRKDAEASMTAFIRSLAGRGLVAVVILKPQGAKTPQP